MFFQLLWNFRIQMKNIHVVLLNLFIIVITILETFKAACFLYLILTCEICFTLLKFSNGLNYYFLIKVLVIKQKRYVEIWIGPTLDGVIYFRCSSTHNILHVLQRTLWSPHLPHKADSDKIAQYIGTRTEHWKIPYTICT